MSLMVNKEAGSIPLEHSQKPKANKTLHAAEVESQGLSLRSWLSFAGMTDVKGRQVVLYGNTAKMGILKTARVWGGGRREGRRGRKSTPGSVLEKAPSLKFSPQSLAVAFGGVLALDSGPGSILGDPEYNSMRRNLPYVSRSVNAS